MDTPYGDIPDRLVRDMRGRYHADGTGPAEAADDRTGRELAEPRGDMPGQDAGPNLPARMAFVP